MLKIERNAGQKGRKTERQIIAGETVTGGY